jgi:hypothetical protein
MGSRQQAAQAIARAARSGQESAATPKGWVQQVAGWHPKYAAAATAGVCAAVIAAQLDKDAAKQALKVGLAASRVIKSASNAIEHSNNL